MKGTNLVLEQEISKLQTWARREDCNSKMVSDTHCLQGLILVQCKHHSLLSTAPKIDRLSQMITEN